VLGFLNFQRAYWLQWGHAVAQLVEATSRKVVCSIHDDVFRIFRWNNTSGRTVALGVIQPVTEMSTRNISWGGEGGRYVGLTTLPHSCADDCLEIWESQPPGTLRVCPRLYRNCFTLFLLVTLFHYIILSVFVVIIFVYFYKLCHFKKCYFLAQIESRFLFYI
jgi:hypothetical protein